MAKLGSEKRPVVVCVQTHERAKEILALCNKHGLKVIVGIEPDKSENISDVERAITTPTTKRVKPKVGRNDPCPCGSGLKFKKCCLKKYEHR